MSKLSEAVEQHMQVTEFAGVRRECIGGVEVSAVASMLPLMTEDEFEELCDSILQFGLRTKIRTDSSGAIVDGRNRMLACLVVDVEPEWDFSTLGDIEEVVTANLRRRNMTQGAKAMAYLKINGLPCEQEEVKSQGTTTSETKSVPDVKVTSNETQAVHASPPTKKKTTTTQAAKDAGVSRRTLQQAMNVTRDAVPEVKAAVASGSLSAQTGEALSQLDPQEQTEIVTGKQEGEIVRASKQAELAKKKKASWKTFNLEKWMPSFAKKISVMLANVPPDLVDRCQRHMAETLGSTIRIERETEDLLNAESIVGHVEQIIAGLPKSERHLCEVAVAQRYAKVIKPKDVETADEAITAIVDGLSEVNKKKLSALLRNRFSPPKNEVEPAAAGKKVRVPKLPMKPTAEVVH